MADPIEPSRPGTNAPEVPHVPGPEPEAPTRRGRPGQDMPEDTPGRMPGPEVPTRPGVQPGRTTPEAPASPNQPGL